MSCTSYQAAYFSQDSCSFSMIAAGQQKSKPVVIGYGGYRGLVHTIPLKLKN
jgi:hypothetical protein